MGWSGNKNKDGKAMEIPEFRSSREKRDYQLRRILIENLWLISIHALEG